MNEPAFPSNGYVASSLGDLSTSEKGMTLRDYFAAKAMQGLATSQDRDGNWQYANAETIADTAYEIADAMLQARNKNRGKDESTSAKF
jgi:hypothetical protein